jgi:hypothetical protein
MPGFAAFLRPVCGESPYRINPRIGGFCVEQFESLIGQATISILPKLRMA